MPFTPIVEQKTYTKQRMEYIDLPQGNSIVRILDTDYVAVETHYVKRVSVACLGDDCPICINNRKIIHENPDTFRDVAGYYPKQVRFFINVFDKTPVKFCPQCKAAIKQTTIPTCPHCNTIIMNEPVVPMNKIKVLGKGKTLFEQLISLENAVLTEDGNFRGLTNFDITLSVTGTGKNTVITPIFSGRVGDAPAITEDMKFDLSNAVAHLTAQELNDLQMGISLKDIFTARSIKPAGAATYATTSPVSEEAKAAAYKLFEQ